MSSNPARELAILSLTEPSIDRTVEGYDVLLAEYGQHRTPANLAKLRFSGPVTAFKLRAVGVEARTDFLSQSSEAKQLTRALRAGLVSVIEGATVGADGSITGGTERTLKVVPDAPFPQLAADEHDALFAQWGGGWNDELGAIVRDRSTFHPGRARPLSVPRSCAQAAT